MSITCTVIEDSISPAGQRLTTFQLHYPRFIHSEFMTHREFSRNASSSRAIPVKKMIDNIEKDMAFPYNVGMNKPGMQAGQSLKDIEIEEVRRCWEKASKEAIKQAHNMLNMPNPPHKQVINRILEPFMHIDVIVTAPSLANFFALRRHPDADPTMYALADAMFKAYEASVPGELALGEWHLPYILQEDIEDAVMYVQENNLEHESESLDLAVTDIIVKISAARCARVSYSTHDGKRPQIVDDLQLYERLVGGFPIHASPAEHQATPDLYMENPDGDKYWLQPQKHGNLKGWVQLRKILPDEYISEKHYLEMDLKGIFNHGAG